MFNPNDPMCQECELLEECKKQMANAAAMLQKVLARKDEINGLTMQIYAQRSTKVN